MARDTDTRMSVQFTPAQVAYINSVQRQGVDIVGRPWSFAEAVRAVVERARKEAESTDLFAALSAHQ